MQRNNLKGAKTMKIAAKAIGMIVGVVVLALTVFLAWIGFGTCFVVSDNKHDHFIDEIAYRMKHPLK